MRNSGIECTKKCAVAAVAAALLLTSCASVEKAKKDPLNFDAAPLYGMVYDLQSQPVAGLSIKIDGKNTVVSDAMGRFAIPDLTRGKHFVQAEKEGFESIDIAVSFDSRSQILYLKMSSAQSLVDLAEKALDESRTDDALAYLDRARAVDDPEYRGMEGFLRAVVLLRMGRPADAASVLEALIAAGDRDLAIGRFLLKLYRDDLKDPKKADRIVAEFPALKN